MAFITLHLALLITTRSLILLLGNKYEAHIYPPEKKVIMNREGIVWETEVSWPEKVEHMVCDGLQLCHGPARSFLGNHVYTFCFCFCTWKMERTMRGVKEEVSVDRERTPNLSLSAKRNL